MWFGSPCGTYVNVKINYVIQVTLWHLCKCYYCWRKKIGFLLNDSCELLLALSYVFPLCANQFKVWNSPLSLPVLMGWGISIRTVKFSLGLQESHGGRSYLYFDQTGLQKFKCLVEYVIKWRLFTGKWHMMGWSSRQHKANLIGS